MWSKIFGLVLAVIPFQAPAHEGEPSPPYEVKETTRFYRVDSADKPNKRGVWISFVVPKGFTLEGCNGMPEIFLDGMECFQDEYPVLRKVLEKNGVKRMLEIELGGGTVDLKKMPEAATAEGRMKECQKSAARSTGYPVPTELFRSGVFKTESQEDGFWGVRGFTYDPGDIIYSKRIDRHQMPCLLLGDYREKSPDGASFIHPKDWLFEDVFDEVVRSMRCELISDIDLRKIRKAQEPREKKKK